MSDQCEKYLRCVLARHSVPINLTGKSVLRSVIHAMHDVIWDWSDGYNVYPVLIGSSAKGTAICAISGESDIDIMLVTDINRSENWYQRLYDILAHRGFAPKKCTVAVRIALPGIGAVDVVPAVCRGGFTTAIDCWLHDVNSRSYIKTNINKRLDLIRKSLFVDEIRLLKIWRSKRSLKFPSFYLELLVLCCLRPYERLSLSQNIAVMLRCLCSKEVMSMRILDPANCNNIISDLISRSDKEALKHVAAEELRLLNRNNDWYGRFDGL